MRIARSTGKAIIQQLIASSSAPLLHAERYRSLSISGSTGVTISSLPEALMRQIQPSESRVLLGMSELKPQKLASQFDQHSYRGKQLYIPIYQRNLKEIQEFVQLPQSFRQEPTYAGWSVGRLPVHQFVTTADGTTKGCQLHKRMNTPGFSYRFLCTNPPSTSSTSSSTVQDSAPKKSPAETGSSDNGNKSEDSKQSEEAGKSVRGGPVSWLSFLLLVLTGAGVIYYYDNEKKKHIKEISNSSNAVKQGPSVGQAAIGGPFKLVNDQGKEVTEEDFMGKWTLIYFGFTHCPDICPDELQKMAAAIDKIKEKSQIEIVPVFISVDPERDTVEQVCEYVKEFHPKLIGLTGKPDEVRKAARAYRVYYMKTLEEGSDYLVDHSIVMYLMSPSMKFVKFFGKNHDVESLADGVIKEIKEYKK